MSAITKRDIYTTRRATSHRTLVKDIRHLTPEDVAGHDAVVHMAELSNDPTGELAPHITYEINHKGSVRLAQHREGGRGAQVYLHVLVLGLWRGWR